MPGLLIKVGAVYGAAQAVGAAKDLAGGRPKRAIETGLTTAAELAIGAAIAGKTRLYGASGTKSYASSFKAVSSTPVGTQLAFNKHRMSGGGFRKR